MGVPIPLQLNGSNISCPVYFTLLLLFWVRSESARSFTVRHRTVSSIWFIFSPEPRLVRSVTTSSTGHKNLLKGRYLMFRHRTYVWHDVMTAREIHHITRSWFTRCTDIRRWPVYIHPESFSSASWSEGTAEFDTCFHVLLIQCAHHQSKLLKPYSAWFIVEMRLWGSICSGSSKIISGVSSRICCSQYIA